jgi:hypothetical protein
VQHGVGVPQGEEAEGKFRKLLRPAKTAFSMGRMWNHLLIKELKSQPFQACCAMSVEEPLDLIRLSIDERIFVKCHVPPRGKLYNL